MVKSRFRDLFGEWPLDENGEPVPPALLLKKRAQDVDLKFLQPMLASFGIPTVCGYPDEGRLWNRLPTHDIEVFVPEPLLEDANNILNGEIIDDFEEDNDGLAF